MARIRLPAPVVRPVAVLIHTTATPEDARRNASGDSLDAVDRAMLDAMRSRNGGTR